ncbi:thiol-activated cytolysin family protein [Maribacter sp. 2307ULW6-5]|uniref:thiol-activated cytolysin family protein n=1 Tax=Maribacter sp. 2307ULW6-5 TaxID=3386275 RepID=UPI0039BC78DA
MKRSSTVPSSWTIRYGCFLFFFLLLSCGSDDPEMDLPTENEEQVPEPETEPEPEGLFADVLQLGVLPNAVTAMSRDTVSSIATESQLVRELFNGNLESVRYQCSELAIEASATINELPLWGDVGAVVYAGSFLQGNSLGQSAPLALPAKRAGGTLALTGADGSVLGTVEVPEFNNTEVALARTELLTALDPAVGLFQMEVVGIADKEHLAFELGWPQADFQTYFDSGLSWNGEEGANRFLVTLQQKYYALSYELPLGMEGYFDPEVAPSDLAPYVSENNPAAFVSQVHYGRRFYLLLETSTFANTALEKINTAFSAFEGGTEGSLQTEVLNDLESLSVTVAVRSNNAQGPYTEMGDVGLSKLAELLSQPVVPANAQAVSYVVRGVSQPNNRAGYSLTARYEQASCAKEGALPPQGFLPLVGLFEDGIGAAFFFDGGHIAVFNGAGTEYAWLNAVTGQISAVYGIKDPDGLLPVLFPDAVGAAFAGSNAGTIYIFDEQGGTVGIYVNTNTLSNNDPTAFPTEAPIRPFISSFSGELVTSEINPFWQTASAPGETAPFLESGIEAAVYMGRANQTDPTDDASYSNYNNFFEKGQSNRWVERDVRVVNRSADYFWSPVSDLRDADRALFPFTEVGAACALELERDVYQQVYFNAAGNQFFIANTDEELVAGPYLLY